MHLDSVPASLKNLSWDFENSEKLRRSDTVIFSPIPEDVPDVVPVSNNHNQAHLQYPPGYNFPGGQAHFANFRPDPGAYFPIGGNCQEGHGLGQGHEMPPSFSNSTISSFESVPPTFTNSVSSHSLRTELQSPSQNAPVPAASTTPRRASPRRSSMTMTPLQPSMYQTPIRRTASQTPRRHLFTHSRSRSRLSLDANGLASVMSGPPSGQNMKSPGGGVNPFYTPPTFLSPRAETINVTPLQTPKELTEDFDAARGPPSRSISPYMLLKKEQEEEDGLPKRFKSDDSSFIRAADVSLNLASRLMSEQEDDSDTPQSGMKHSRTLSHLSLLVDPENSESMPKQIPTPPTSSNSMAPHSTPHSMAPTPHSMSSHSLSDIHARPPINQFPPQLSRSRSSMNLSDIAMSKERLLVRPPLSQNPSGPVPHVFYTHTPNVVVKDGDDRKLKPEKKKKLHECPLCHSTFQRPEHVKRHMRSHSSEKPFLCTQPNCGKRFNRNDNLKAHLRKIHHM